MRITLLILLCLSFSYSAADAAMIEGTVSGVDGLGAGWTLTITDDQSGVFNRHATLTVAFPTPLFDEDGGYQSHTRQGCGLWGAGDHIRQYFDFNLRPH